MRRYCWCFLTAFLVPLSAGAYGDANPKLLRSESTSTVDVLFSAYDKMKTGDGVKENASNNARVFLRNLEKLDPKLASIARKYDDEVLVQKIRSNQIQLASMCEAGKNRVLIKMTDANNVRIEKLLPIGEVASTIEACLKSGGTVQDFKVIHPGRTVY